MRNYLLTIISIVTTLNVRLRDGDASYQGRLEVEYNGEWGTVCNKSFSQGAQSVVCKQLGFSNVQEISASFPSGPAGGKIWLENVQCNGDEKSIFNCNHSDWGNTSCTHEYDIGIICLRKIATDIIMDALL